MPHLVDTNVLLRLLVPADPRHPAALASIEALAERDEELLTAGQNFIELWNVATRPVSKNGLGMTPPSAEQMLQKLEPAFPRLTEPAHTFDVWRELVVRFGVSGVHVHDARLVAVMLANHVFNLLTFNAQDFRRYRDLGVQAHDPESVR